MAKAWPKANSAGSTGAFSGTAKSQPIPKSMEEPTGISHHEVRHITARDGTYPHSFHEIVQHAIAARHLTVG